MGKIPKSTRKVKGFLLDGEREASEAARKAHSAKRGKTRRVRHSWRVLRAPVKKPAIFEEIEKHKDIYRRELVWAITTPELEKASKDQLVEIESTGDAGEQEYDADTLPGNTEYVMHTHLSPRAMRDYSSAEPMASFADIATLSQQMRHGKTKRSVIATVEWGEKISGYTIYQLSRPLTPEVEAEFIRLSNHYRRSGESAHPGRGRAGFRMRQVQPVEQISSEEYAKLLRRKLGEHGISLLQISRPMPGYRCVRDKVLKGTKFVKEGDVSSHYDEDLTGSPKN